MDKKLRCPQCRAFVSFSYLDQDKMEGTCPFCGHPFLASQLGWGSFKGVSLRERFQLYQKSLAVEKEKLRDPEYRAELKKRLRDGGAFKAQIRPSGGGLEICIPWSHKKSGSILFFAVFWLGMMAVFLPKFQFKKPEEMLFLLPHVLIGLGLLYYGLLLRINSTYLLLRPNQIQVRHRPLWAWGQKDLSLGGLHQVRTDRVVHKSKNTNTITYSLVGEYKGGSQKKLVTGIGDIGLALQVEKAIEDYLSIDDDKQLDYKRN